MKKSIVIGSLAWIIFFAISCEKMMPPAPRADEVMDAPLDDLTPQQNKLFLAGAEEFDEVYTAQTGLGPVFVATSCAGCHSGDNKGHPFTALTRFGQSDTLGNKFLALGAPQLQHRAIPGYSAETLPTGATATKFIAPIASGMGFIELVSDADILSMADPNDANGDGISGVPNWNTLPDWVQPSANATAKNGKYICRFGRKASTYNLHQQVVGAFNNDMGITTSFLPNDPVNYAAGTSSVPVSTAEVSDESVNATVFYIQALQAPIQRNRADETVMKGEAVFFKAGCENCHKQTLKTQGSSIEALSNKEFHPYTDLLLHDMGDELNDHYTEGSALAPEWRTTPLWGLGLSSAAQGGMMFLLHDGRAHSYAEAIELHGGEAAKSREAYRSLSNEEKEALRKFLDSL